MHQAGIRIPGTAARLTSSGTSAPFPNAAASSSVLETGYNLEGSMRLERMLDAKAALLLCGVALMAAACQRGPAETPGIPYHLVDVTTHIDHKTGNVVRVA